MEAPTPGDGALGVFFPKEVSQSIDRWRQVYLPQHREIPPHITVVYPPFVLLDEWPSVRAAVAECLGTFHPFDVTLKELGTFAGPPHVLWLKPEDGGNLSRIHAALVERCPSYVSDPASYVPHVTVGLFDSEKGLSEARQAIPAEIASLHFRVDELSYVVRGEDGVWHIHERLFLR